MPENPTKLSSNDPAIAELQKQFKQLFAYQQVILEQLAEINGTLGRISWAIGIFFGLAALLSLLRGCSGF